MGMHMCVHNFLHIHMQENIFEFLCLSLFLSLSLCVCVSLSVSLFLRLIVCLCVFMSAFDSSSQSFEDSSSLFPFHVGACSCRRSVALLTHEDIQDSDSDSLLSTPGDSDSRRSRFFCLLCNTSPPRDEFNGKIILIHVSPHV